jgi:hypothetical protein
MFEGKLYAHNGHVEQKRGHGRVGISGKALKNKLTNN